MKLTMGMFTSKMQEDVVPNINALIEETTSDEYIEKKINDILGNAELKKE